MTDTPQPQIEKYCPLCGKKWKVIKPKKDSQREYNEWCCGTRMADDFCCRIAYNFVNGHWHFTAPGFNQSVEFDNLAQLKSYLKLKAFW